jgi:flagellar hook-basal body complex protein FliE
MSAIAALAAIAAGGVDGPVSIAGARPPGIQPASGAGGASFGDMISAGLHQIDRKVASADALVRSFALDDNVPLHQVTFALEEARLSVELAMQVQTRLVEGYRQLMNMQL